MRHTTPSTNEPSPPGPIAGLRFPCEKCGAKLVYLPGADHLKCPYCAHVNPIPTGDALIEELDFDAYCAKLSAQPASHESDLIKCTACAAEIQRPPHAVAMRCPYCGADLVMTTLTKRVITPQALLPFKIPLAEAQARFRQWLRKLWFAPSELKRMARVDQTFSGIYVPFWTFDCRTISDYRGERGDDYTTVIMVTQRINGRTVSTPRTVTRTRWRPVSGRVQDQFDDILIGASNSLPRRHVDALEPWDLPALKPYADAYLSGFLAESYQVELPEAFEHAKAAMTPEIHATIRRDIGGDHQRIHAVQTQYLEKTFKHILLPVWMSAYRYRKKLYQFLVNARTGEVKGDRPWSWLKMAGAFLAAILVAIVAVWIFQQSR